MTESLTNWSYKPLLKYFYVFVLKVGFGEILISRLWMGGIIRLMASVNM